MALHDMTCSACGLVQLDTPLEAEGKKCRGCKKGRMEILWRTHYQRDAAVHSKERAVLLYSPKEGKFQYPPTADRPIPKRLRQRGYERVEMSSLRALDTHARRTGSVSHVANFDRGSGRSLDGD